MKIILAWMTLLVGMGMAAPIPAEQVPNVTFNGAEEVVPYYFYDYVNKPFPIYPEPIWRQMFPSLYQRIEAERRAFGVPGQSARELDYHIRAWRLQRAKLAHPAGGYAK